MTLHPLRVRPAAIAGALALVVAVSAPATAVPPLGHHALEVAQAGGTEPRELEPRYQPAPVEPKGWYNDRYLFGMTRGVAESTLHPGAKVPLFALTLPLDLVLLPFAAIGGMFG